MVIWLPKTAGPYSLSDVTKLVLGWSTPVFKENPGAIKGVMETDSLILHSIMGIEPPPLLKVWGVIDWQNEQRGMKTIKNDRKYLKFMGCRPFINGVFKIPKMNFLCPTLTCHLRQDFGKLAFLSSKT
jgi:hypothetical protein